MDLLFWEHVCGLNYFFYCVLWVVFAVSCTWSITHWLERNHPVRRCILVLRSEGFYPDALYLVSSVIVYVSLMFGWRPSAQKRFELSLYVLSASYLTISLPRPMWCGRYFTMSLSVCLTFSLSLSLHPPLPSLPAGCKMDSLQWLWWKGQASAKEQGPRLTSKR